MATMEKTKSRQKRKKDRIRIYHVERPIPDAPTMEEFECLLGESPTNYPRVEGIENMESELHSAAIDTEIFEKETETVATVEATQQESEINGDNEVDHKITLVDTSSPPAVDEVDTIELSNTTAFSEQLIDSNSNCAEQVETTNSNLQSIGSTPTAPAMAKVESEKCNDKPVVKNMNKVASSSESVAVKTVVDNESTSKLATKFKEKIKIVNKVVPFSEAQLTALYNNQELTLIESFITEFVETQMRSNAVRQQHRLHELLMSYLRVRNHLILNSHELETLKKNCKEVQKQLWHLDKASITESGECQDGNPVDASHEYSIAHFSQQALISLTKNLSAIKELLHNVQALYCYEAEMLKLQVEYYIQRVCISCKELSTLPQNAPVNLTAIQMPSQTMPQLLELRMCITILFNFQRRALKDGKFVLDSREWLSKLVAVLLRVATWQDHLFILNHILRCPGGVTNWAASFVQAPAMPKNRGITTSPLNDPYLDHMVATLAVILLPIKEREVFLEQVQISLQDNSSAGDTVWVMLDEEGEEDEDIANTGANLYESDLITLLNQIPVDKIFEQVLLIDKQGSGYTQISKGITEHHILKIFAFSTTLVRLFRQGLKTYDSPRYRQLAKRLSALIRDVVQYASDQWEAFDKNQVIDQSMILRLQTEYNCFFFRATMCIYSSRRLGAWQYLAAIPYHIVSINTLWHIFYALHRDAITMEPLESNLTTEEWEIELNSPLMRKQFEEKLIDMPGDESYFLLTTFANMAMARTNRDHDFIRATTIDLFRIGFLSEKTQESCSKDARSLLSNLTSKHPVLLSDILVKLRDNFVSVGKLSLYLFTELSIGRWIPKEEDIVILSNWLHHNSLLSTESLLARLILTHLNWGLDKNGDLYLPLNLHYRMALLVVELAIKYVPEIPGQTASLFAEGVKQVSSIVRPQNSEQAFAHWTWEMVTRLRIHQLDQSDSTCRNAMINPAEAFFYVPDIDSNASVEILVHGVREKQPIACFVATMMTLWGHSIPLICTKGFTQLSILQCFYKYEHILIVLHHIIPLFLYCSDSLFKNERFNSIIVSLVTADRTYVKMAKNFISPEFPGPIVKHFATMIESHMTNYKRYCLQSPEPFVRLWLSVLVRVPDWNRDQNVMFLMDVVIRAAFFYLDARATTENIFQNLFSNQVNGKSSGSLGSFLSWATGSGNSQSLLGGSVQSIWLAYKILLTEQHEKELKTGLWREFLSELSQSKTSLDATLKRACITVKISPFNSNGLAIYRWSQQALDTPLDHPLLPLLWQSFFALFLSRAPSTTGLTDRGGFGDKFFEGMINLSYLKKVKKRLHDTTEYFQVKGEHDSDNGKPITDERRMFYFNAAKFYKTLSLWLEEPRLQESGLYLPALPPQYMSQKLLLLMQGDYSPWLEYIDHEQVQQHQLKAILKWQATCYRTVDKSQTKNVPTPTTPLEPADPIQRIYRRLNTYECPEPPPPLSRHSNLIEHISTDTLYDSNRVVRIVKPYLKGILDYAQTYNLLVSEHTAVDCNFLELIPTLYKEVESQITLHALCDPAPPGLRRSRSGTPPTVHCAGPAVIRIKICEARVNDGVDQMISQNRAEYENLLIKACQPPPSKVTQGCVFIDHLIALLEHELGVNRTCENTAVLSNVQESGVNLFYHLVEFYNEDAALCPPTKQLLTTCIEKLGQFFISGEENEGPRLLSTIMQRSNLGGLLGPHFTPVAGGASRFLHMYQTVVDLSTGSNTDLCFVLLSKFDVGSWLNYRRPRLSERSTFIDLVSKALCDIGLNPDEEKLMLHELFRNHMRLVLLHEFPEHYGEVLSVILKGSEGQNMSIDVWRDLLGALSGRPKSAVPIHPGKIREEIRRYATEQRLLTRQEIYDTAVLLSKHFMKERLQYGLYGLYPKYRVYNEPLIIFLGMIGHALVVLTLQLDRGSLADQLCERIWPVLSDMFAPWITPYWTRNLREPTAAWIQQLTDDRSVLLPWIITDGPYANKTVAIFVECIRFIIDTMPASSKILCYLWQFYVNNFAHASVKDHILNVIHGNFLSLPWDRFSPGINDVELMIKVVDQYLPDSHLFLGSVFVSINWTPWISQVLTTQPLAVSARSLVCLLNLLVKLSNEPNVRQNEKAVQLINDAEKFPWHLVDATIYDQIINWHVMSCDPRVIISFTNNSNQIHPIDVAINNLLKVVAAYDPVVTHFHPTTLKKRQMYVRSSVKLLVNCTTRHKTLVSTNIKAFTSTLSKMLDEMDMVITSTVSAPQQSAEAGLLLTELLHSINQSGFLVEQLRISWSQWLSEKNPSNPILQGILRVIGTSVISSSIIGELTEAALEAYFKHNITDDIEPTWSSVLGIFQPIVPRQPPIEGVLVAEGKLLTLYATLLKRLPSCRDIREEGMVLVNLVDWITAIKPTDVAEAKFPLLWAKAFELAYRQCQYSENTIIAARSLKRLSRALLTLADDAGQGWGILGAIGLRRGSQLSIRCKFLSRALGIYCLAQLPESKSEQQIIRFTSHSPGIVPARCNDLDPLDVRPNSDTSKGIQILESLVTNKQYAELKGDIEQAIKMIRDSANSLHNAVAVTGLLVTELYNEKYLHVLND